MPMINVCALSLGMPFTANNPLSMHHMSFFALICYVTDQISFNVWYYHSLSNQSTNRSHHTQYHHITIYLLKFAHSKPLHSHPLASPPVRQSVSMRCYTIDICMCRRYWLIHNHSTTVFVSHCLTPFHFTSVCCPIAPLVHDPLPIVLNPLIKHLQSNPIHL
jgi:fucose permease